MAVPNGVFLHGKNLGDQPGKGHGSKGRKTELVDFDGTDLGCE